MITDMITTAPGFQTSVNIAYDLNNSEKIKRLIPTTSAVNLFRDLLLSTDDVATNRARILIGAYGKGKSHIILTILSFLCRKDPEESAALLEKVREVDPGIYDYAMEYINSKKKLLPVIINGSNTSLIQSFLGALCNTLKQNELSDLMPETHFKAAEKMIERWRVDYPQTLCNFEKAVNMPADEFESRLSKFDVEAYTTFEKVYPSLTAGSEFNPFIGFDAVELYEKVVEKLPEKGYTGIFVVYDEFSKYLESSMASVSEDNIEMLQKFAEKCCRSGERQIHLLLISHKEIENYVDIIDSKKLNEWRGVSERFTHIHMDSDFSQIYEVIAHAILKDRALWENFYLENRYRFTNLRHRYCENTMFSECDQRNFESVLLGCYPLHPVTTFMLPRISEKVAQNERTLFTFISGQEQTTLTGALKKLDGDFPLVTPDILYDYFAPQMRKEVYTSELHQLYRLTTAILAKLDPNGLKAKIVKTISLIYCLAQFERLAPTVETIIGVFYSDEVGADEIRTAIEELVHDQCVVYLKRSNAFLKLKESSGVNIYKAISDLVQKRSAAMTTANLLNTFNLEPYIYPLKYNDGHEMTRYFEMIFVTAGEILENTDLQSVVDAQQADGIVYALLPGADEERIALTEKIKKISSGTRRAVFVIPDRVGDILAHLRNLDATQILREAAADDDVLFDEYDVIYQDLSEVVHRFISQYTHPEEHAAKYYYAGEERQLYRKAHLSQLLSRICEETYPNTPIINNEVLNKNQLTTVAVNSRTRLLGGLLSNPLLPNLGLNGSGQDVSFMRSTLLITGVLEADGDFLRVNLTPPDPLLANVLTIINDFIRQAQTETGVDVLYQRLVGKESGIGLRKGLIPIYLAVVLRKYQKHLVVKNQFGEQAITPTLLNQINDAPDQYTVQMEQWTDNKQEYIDHLDTLFADFIYENERGKNNYAYLSVAMGRWYLSLPKYVKDMKRQYNGRTAEERFSDIDRVGLKFLALLKQPSIGAFDLLFTRIPKCFGYEEVSGELARNIEDTKKFFDQAENVLLNTLSTDLKIEIGIEHYEDVSLFSAVTDWYESLQETTRNKLFANSAERLFSVIKKATNDEIDLVESMARVITGVRVDDWRDANIDQFLAGFSEYKRTIDVEDTVVPEIEEKVSADTGTNYSITFVDGEGNLSHRSFERVERSTKTKSMYNRIKAALDQAGQAVSPQEKRQVLMEILEQMC